MTRHCILLTADLLRSLSKADAGFGWLDLAVLQAEHLSSVSAYTYGEHNERVRIAGRELDLPAEHPLRRQAGVVEGSAVWYRGTADARIAEAHQYLRMRRRSFRSEFFSTMINQGWRTPPPEGFIALVEDRSESPSTWCAWFVSSEEAEPMLSITYDNKVDPSTAFDGLWPCDETRGSNVAVIGTGSIGGEAALALSRYEIGTITLIDYDRLTPHNTARHACGLEHIGRYKVDAVRDLVVSRRPSQRVETYRLDVIDEADHLRPLLHNGIDAVICCADGVAARQATAQLCAQANVDAVFACVLEDGALGEIVRNPRFPDVGCLHCLRRTLSMDPEPRIDLDYGTGTPHRPMTAIAGDLSLMGRLAARVAVAGVLERAGFRDQRLADNHLIVGLRPTNDWEAPFDVSRVLEVRSSALPPPDPLCPTCRADSTYV